MLHFGFAKLGLQIVVDLAVHLGASLTPTKGDPMSHQGLKAMIREAGCSRDCTVLSRRPGDRDPETGFVPHDFSGWPMPCHAAQPLIMHVTEPSVLPNQLYLPLMIMATAPAASALPPGARIYISISTLSRNFQLQGNGARSKQMPEEIGVTVTPKQVKR